MQASSWQRTGTRCTRRCTASTRRSGCSSPLRSPGRSSTACARSAPPRASIRPRSSTSGVGEPRGRSAPARAPTDGRVRTGLQRRARGPSCLNPSGDSAKLEAMQMPHLARPPYAAVPAGPRPIAVGPDFHSGKKAREGRVMIGITVAILLALLATGARAGEQTKPFEGFTKYVKYHVRYEVNQDGTHVETHDWALKVLSDQGVSVANSASVSFSDRLDGVQVQALPK